MDIAGTIIAFLWGMAEGTFFFLLPDIWLTRTALYSIRNSSRQVLSALVGAIFAGAFMFHWASKSPEQALKKVAEVPFVRAWMFDKAHHDLSQKGMWAPVFGPTKGIPFKVYAVLAPKYMSSSAFIWASIPARLWRFVLMIFLFGLVGWLVRKKSQERLLPYIHGLFWILSYAWYWTHV